MRSLAAMLGTAALLGIAFYTLAEAQQASAPTQGETPAETTNPTESKSTTTSTSKTEKTKPKLEKATFASGCFWCGEAVFERIPGVKNVVSGYSGGTVPNPTYEEVSSGLTGHAEAFQVEYDPAVAPYEKLLKYFWASHDPTTPNQQGPDFGTQYRSVIFYHNEAQRAAAAKSMQELTSKGAFLDAISTQLVPMTVFYPAEPYHQDYFRKHKSAAYCQTFIVPKIKKLQHLNIK
jgi:peptide-methionine (S)-S-oxide reductase